MTDAPAAEPDIPVEAVLAAPVDRSGFPEAGLRWKQTGNPADLSAAVDEIQPRLAYHQHRYGLGADPLAAGHARVLAAKAIQSYDPAAGASFFTWLDRGMQPLSRFKRLRATAVRVPEKIQIDSLKISQAQTDFEEEHGREPELDELADRAGMTLKRLHQVRAAFKKMSGEAAFDGNIPANKGTDFTSEALEAVWDEADSVDRAILERRAGFGGKPQIPPGELAAMLGISPVALSRRSARLGAKLDEILEHLER